MNRILTHISLLEYMSKLTSQQQKSLISGAPKELILTLAEIALNILEKNFPLTKEQIHRLKKFEKPIVSLTQKKHSLTKRREILRGNGAFLKTFIQETVPPLIQNVIKCGYKSKKKLKKNFENLKFFFFF